MIEVITCENAFMHRDDLAAMFRLRHRVFKERLAWDVNSRHGLERDVYDLFNPIYLLAKDGAGRILGSWRLLSTAGPNMLKDVFPQLMDNECIPSDPSVWETSRFAVEAVPDSAEGLTAVSSVTGELFCGLVELCLMYGIREIVTVYDVRIGRLLKRIGCHPYWSGKPLRIGNSIAVAGRFEISDQVLKTLQETNGVFHSVLAVPADGEAQHAA